MFLEDMTDDELKYLYKEAEQMADTGHKWLKQYGLKNRDEPFEFKNPYWHVQYTCQEILGQRAVEE